MRIRVLSDLHREFGHEKLPEVAADVVVLAGDIDRGTKGVAWARQTFPGVPVLYVAGNHEHYDERIGCLLEKLRESAAGSNVHILENETFGVDCYHFFRATLWTDFSLFDDRQSAMLTAGAKGTGITGYRKIRRHDTGKLQPKHTAMLHADTRLALTQFLAGGDRTRSVVITHYAPTIESVATGKEADLISAGYVSKMDDFIALHGPALWVHGHIHENRYYGIGNTRILNNAFGYPTSNGAETVGSRRLGCCTLSNGRRHAPRRDLH
jgi:Icc-related predicted phosphoesterase